MVGKPTIPLQIETELLNHPLDQERAASMADEGGRAGAEMECQDSEAPSFHLASLHPLPQGIRPANAPSVRTPTLYRWGFATGITAVTGAALYLAFRKRAAPALRPE